MRLHLLGVRGSTPAPGPEFSRVGGHTSCVAFSSGDRPPNLLLDAGTGIRSVSRLTGARPFEGSILLSHLHWDHTQGLPFFRVGDHPGARVDLHLPVGDEEDPAEVLGRALSPPHFPITPAQLRGRWRFLQLREGRHELEGFEVLAREIPHKGGRTFGFRVSDGTSSVAYLSDHHPVSLGAGPHGYGPYHEAAMDLVAGVDLLLHDAQYTPAEFEVRHDFGHSTTDYAVGLAEAGEVGRLALFHHDPERTDDEVDAIVARYASAGVPVIAAHEGATIDVGVTEPIG